MKCAFQFIQNLRSNIIRIANITETHLTRRCASINSVFFSRPAIGTDLAFINADRVEHIVETVVSERGEMQLAAKIVDHALIFGGIRIDVFLCVLIGRVNAVGFYDSARDKVHI